MTHGLLAALMRASLEGGLLLLLLWSITRLWPSMPASARRWAWWLGSLRLLMGLLPVPTITMAWSPSLKSAAATAVASEPVVAIEDALATPIEATQAVASTSWWEVALIVLALVWGAGVIIGLGFTLLRLVRLRRLWRSAHPFTDARALAWRAEWALVLGHDRVPEIRLTPATQVPLALGLFRPAILLPADSERLPDDALRLVLAHELSHLRRHDPLLGWVPAAAEMIFWFHPLVRLAAREYLAAREELCDADALRATSASPRDYGALLLGFAVGRHSILPGAASCGTPAGRHLKRRLEMLSKTSPSFLQRVGAATLVATFLLVAFAPVRLAALETGALEMNGNQTVSGKPTPSAYLLKIEGQKGTRGSIHIPSDLDAARDLDRWGRTAVYFRVGSQRWIIHDEQAIREVRSALVAEDRFEARQAPIEARRDELEREVEQIEKRGDALELRKEALEARKAVLEEKRDDLEAQGKSARSLSAQIEQLQSERDELSRRYDELAAARDRLSKHLEQLDAKDRVSEAERERLDRQTLHAIERIGRRAIERGIAERYSSKAGGSSSQQARPSTLRVFISPGTQIW